MQAAVKWEEEKGRRFFFPSFLSSFQTSLDLTPCLFAHREVLFLGTPFTLPYFTFLPFSLHGS